MRDGGCHSSREGEHCSLMRVGGHCFSSKEDTICEGGEDTV